MCVNGSSSQSNFEDDTASIYPVDNLDKTESIESGPVVELVNEKPGTEINRQEEAITPTQRSARIHDFCLEIPYGGFLFFGGLLGFAFSRNPTGLIFGSAISAMSIFSLMVWSSGGSSIPFNLGQTAISVAFLWRHLQSYSSASTLIKLLGYKNSIYLADGITTAYFLIVAVEEALSCIECCNDLLLFVCAGRRWKSSGKEVSQSSIVAVTPIN